jgi:hypothetical protein
MGERKPGDSGGVDRHYKTWREIMSKETSKQELLLFKHLWCGGGATTSQPSYRGEEGWSGGIQIWTSPLPHFLMHLGTRKRERRNKRKGKRRQGGRTAMSRPAGHPAKSSKKPYTFCPPLKHVPYMPVQKSKNQKHFSFFSFLNSFNYFENFHFIKCKVRKTKYAVGKGENKLMNDEVIERNQINYK